jgi:putative peptidoglycan lipid II flippase
MVKSLFRYIHREISGIHEAAYLLGFFAIASQILALIRDRLLAYSFGAGHTLDIYYAAFRVPDFIFVTVSSLVSASVLIPFFVHRLDRGELQGKKFVDSVFTIFFTVMVAVSFVAFFLMPFLMRLIFPHWVNDPFFNELIQLSRLLLLSPFFLGLSNLLSSVTQMYNRFFIYALSPLVYNIGIIIGIVFLVPYFGLIGLGYGVAIGAFLHFFIQVPFVVSRGLFPKLSFALKGNEIGKVIMTSLPRTLALSSNEIAKFCFIVAASFLGVGAVSVFNFSWNLQSVPLSIIGVSYSLAVFPTLTRLHSGGKTEEFIQKMVLSARHIIFLALPATILFVVLRAQIVRTILGAGEFDWNDTRLTAAALALFTISLIPQCLVLLFVRAYYSSGATRKPLFINVFSSVLTIALGFLFIRLSEFSVGGRHMLESLLRVRDIPGTAVLMLPLAYTVGVTINMLIHWFYFEKDFGTFTKHVRRTIFQVGIASLATGFVSYAFLQLTASLFDQDTVLGIFSQGFFSGIAGIIVGILVLMAFKNQEFIDMVATLHKKIWKARPLSPVSSDPGMSEIS